MYHINPETKRPNICKTPENCKAEVAKSKHYATAAEATLAQSKPVAKKVAAKPAAKTTAKKAPAKAAAKPAAPKKSPVKKAEEVPVVVVAEEVVEVPKETEDVIDKLINDPKWNGEIGVEPEEEDTFIEKLAEETGHIAGTIGRESAELFENVRARAEKAGVPEKLEKAKDVAVDTGKKAGEFAATSYNKIRNYFKNRS